MQHSVKYCNILNLTKELNFQNLFFFLLNIYNIVIYNNIKFLIQTKLTVINTKHRLLVQNILYDDCNLQILSILHI